MLKINNVDLNTIESEYKYEFDIFEESDKLKYLNCLSTAEKRVLILYCETNSYRKVAEYLNVSATTVNNYIKKIKNKLKIYGLSNDY